MANKIGFIDEDPCQNYHPLNRETRKVDFFDRKNIYNCDYTWNYYCSLDWKGPGWYRVVSPAGTMLAESDDSVQLQYHCGTMGAAWLKNGTHADVANGDTVDAQACVDQSCWFSTQIKIKNCGNYFVYNLQPLTQCDSGYCTM